MSDADPVAKPVEIPAFPPSLVRAADHLTAKFQELPWFISAQPASIDGRPCLRLLIRDRGLPRTMVLPTSFETFKVVIDRAGRTAPISKLSPSNQPPVW